jgi:hypothetical protein
MLGFIPNLHITTEGDSALASAWIPLGKQIIRELIATRPYATHRTVVVDGDVEVRCKVVGEQRYIHIKAGGCTVYMDSGAVDLINMGFTNPARLESGRIRYSTELAALVAQGRLVGAVEGNDELSSKAPAEGAVCGSFLVQPRS